MESLRPTLHRGVTVVELLVVLGIIGILVVVVVTSHATFNRTILLNYTTYDVALTIRSAETYGLGSRSRSGVGTNVGYGINFTEGDSFVLFADTFDIDTACHRLRAGADEDTPDTIEGDCVYGGDDETVEVYKLGNSMSIENLWYKDGIAWNEEVETLDIVFARPNPEAFVSVDGIYRPNASACIEISSPQGGVAHIVVERTGQIYVQGGWCAGAPAGFGPEEGTGFFE